MNANNTKTVNCREVRRELLERFDNGTLEMLPQSLLDHLRGCPACQGEKARLKTLSNGLKHLTSSDVGNSYWINVLPGVRRRLAERRTPPKKDLAWAPAMGLALVLVFALTRQPSNLAPPAWYRSHTVAPVEMNGLNDQEYEQLVKAWDQRDSVTLGLSGTEMNFIRTFSDNSTTIIDDPVDQLADMSDAAVEAILRKLAEALIRS